MEITVTVESVDLASVIPGKTRVYDPDTEEYDYADRTVGEAVAEQVAAALMKTDEYRLLKHRVLEIRDEEIRAQVKPIVEKAITTSIQPTNGYGRPVGQPVSLEEVIVKEAHAYLTKRDGYGDRSVSVVQKVVSDAVEKAIKTELARAIVEEKEKVVAAVRAKAADLIATAVKEGVGR
jgi:hypothetical protein